jgi:hypothetical protein
MWNAAVSGATVSGIVAASALSVLQPGSVFLGSSQVWLTWNSFVPGILKSSAGSNRLSWRHDDLLLADLASRAWMGETMGLILPFDTPGFGTPSQVEAPLFNGQPAGSSGYRTHIPQYLLRYGGLTMDARTGVTHWRGRILDLSLEEHELLGILLRHAGQILSTERFATLLGAESRLVHVRMSTLEGHLKHEGVTCLPRQASGLGYVLWRS